MKFIFTQVRSALILLTLHMLPNVVTVFVNRVFKRLLSTRTGVQNVILHVTSIKTYSLISHVNLWNVFFYNITNLTDLII
jgi:hypothetical protein